MSDKSASEVVKEQVLDKINRIIDTTETVANMATTDTQTLDNIYGAGTGEAIQTTGLVTGAIGAVVAKGKGGKTSSLHTNINDRKLTLNLPQGYKKNKDGNIITLEGEVLTKGTFTTPSGRTYDHYGREIDMDLKIPNKINPVTGKEYTNRGWLSKNNNPYVRDINGKPVPTNQHHIDQRASGPLIELEAPIHQRDTKNLHPFGNKPNPNDPVKSRTEFDKDRQSINKQRLEQLNNLEEN